MLQVLGRGVCFDEAAEAILVDEETLRVFFHKLCEGFARELSAEYIFPATDPHDLNDVVKR